MADAVMMRSSTFLFCMLALAQAGAAAELYKWVDAQGRVHYSNERPPKGVQFETLNTEPETIKPGAEIDWGAKEKAFQERQAIRKKQQTQREAEIATTETERQVKCRVARLELASAEASSPRLARRAPPAGSLGVEDAGSMNNAERSTLIDQAQADINKWCE